jgi:transcriptional regulator with XRE-family HTH domain
MTTKTKTSKRSHAHDLGRFGARLAAQRHQLGWTQADLAASMDISIAYVSLLERGRRNPPYTTVVALAREMGVAAIKLVAD